MYIYIHTYHIYICIYIYIHIIYIYTYISYIYIIYIYVIQSLIKQHYFMAWMSFHRGPGSWAYGTCVRSSNKSKKHN